MQHAEFINQMAFPQLGKWNIHYNLGIFFDDEKRIVGNSHYGYYLFQDEKMISKTKEEMTGVKVLGEEIRHFAYDMGRIIGSISDAQLERVKSNTIIHYHAIIRLALCYARKMGYIKENPIEQVEKPEKNKFVGTYYTLDEVNQLIALTKGTKLEIAVIFACFYGPRRSECVGLRWSAFDFENNIFHINHTVVLTSVNGKRTLVTKDAAKTDATIRSMPLSADIKKRLLEIKCMQENNKKRLKKNYNNQWTDYLMVTESGDLISPDYVTDTFRGLIKKNKMRQIRFHDLRHTCASLLLNKGKGKVTMKDIQEWLGHSDYKTTANIYAHLDLSSKYSSLETLDSIIEI